MLCHDATSTAWGAVSASRWPGVSASERHSVEFQRHFAVIPKRRLSSEAGDFVSGLVEDRFHCGVSLPCSSNHHDCFPLLCPCRLQKGASKYLPFIHRFFFFFFFERRRAQAVRGARAALQRLRPRYLCPPPASRSLRLSLCAEAKIEGACRRRQGEGKGREILADVCVHVRGRPRRGPFRAPRLHIRVGR
ncbi:hypothetical protein T492DRAFT_47114 [Pavlovales sp. CCMP2436]|nr:hypothetical protein T492DRAFT_47114 [Pavlovales sp. CCMP2436]